MKFSVGQEDFFNKIRRENEDKESSYDLMRKLDEGQKLQVNENFFTAPMSGMYHIKYNENGVSIRKVD